MSTAVADPLPPRGPAGSPAIVVADDAHRELVGSQLARVLRPACGAVAVRGVADVAADRPAAVVLAAHADLAAGLAAVRRIRREAPGVPIVVVAPDDTATVARQALNAGADAFVPAAAVAHALTPALAAVTAGLVCVPRVSRRVIAKPTFSHREKEVLGLLVEGLTNRQIAARLYLAESTVKTHVAAAFAKLGVRSRQEAATVLLDPAEGLGTTALAPAGGRTRCK